MTQSDYDIAIVGGGIGGMITAVRASQGRKRVVVLERLSEERYLCNSRLTGGVFHCALNDVRTPPEELTRFIVAATEGAAAPELAALLGHNAMRSVEWLQSLGIRFVRGSADPWHSFVLAPPGIAQLGRNWEGRAGDVLLRSLERVLTNLGGVVFRGYDVQELLMTAGRCEGVVVSTANGTVEVRAEAVVLADGGFQANRGLLAKHVTPRPDKIIQRNPGSGVGAGLRMAMAAGAAISDLTGFYGHVLSRDGLVDDRLWPYPWLDELLKNYILVGPTGERFADEGRGGVYIANCLAKLAAPDSTFVICDEAGWNGAGRERFLPPNPNLEKAGATVLRGSTIEELAAKAGIDALGLKAEVHRYNNATAAGTSVQLTPTRSSEKYAPLPIATAPFYAIPAAAGITYTMGGMRIDTCCRVQSKDGGVIPGLYAVGSTTGGLEGGPNVGYVGGLVKAAVTALACAENLAGLSA